MRARTLQIAKKPTSHHSRNIACGNFLIALLMRSSRSTMRAISCSSTAWLSNCSATPAGSESDKQWKRWFPERFAMGTSYIAAAICSSRLLFRWALASNWRLTGKTSRASRTSNCFTFIIPFEQFYEECASSGR